MAKRQSPITAITQRAKYYANRFRVYRLATRAQHLEIYDRAGQGVLDIYTRADGTMYGSATVWVSDSPDGCYFIRIEEYKCARIVRDLLLPIGAYNHG